MLLANGGEPRWCYRWAAENPNHAGGERWSPRLWCWWCQ